MLLGGQILDGIEAGRIRRVFRRWKRPTVKAGGSLKTAIGVLAIHAVEPIRAADLTEEDAALAGFPSLAALRRELAGGREGTLYRIEVTHAGPDPRAALRQHVPADADLADIAQRLERMDARSGAGPWTRATLQLVHDHPAVRAADLAGMVGRDTQPFKRDVRKLKNLGLTESLEIGYRLSPRGRAVLARLSR